ncbi:MAG: type II toxin-antitoxin system prevent-host-death family antitoxin [Pseudomonadota bacterium]
MTKQVSMHEAKSRLSELGEMVWKGERVIIAKAGKPYLELLPHRETRKPRTPGRFASQIKIAPDFDTNPIDVIDAFEGE